MHYDALIVGARPAGAATALLLARAGARVLVVERDAAGTDTLSTHALMRGAVQQLAKWGLLDRVRAAGTPAVRQTRFVYGDEEVVVDIRDREGVDALYAPRRTVLDPIIARAAQEAGAEILYRTAFRDVLRDRTGRVTGALVGSSAKPVTADIVIGADGRRSSVARAVGARTTVAGRNRAAAVYAYFDGVADRGYRWHYAPGATGVLIPTNGGLHNVYAALPPERFRAAGTDLATRLRETIREVSPSLAEELAGARMVSRPLAFAGEPGWLRDAAGPGWALVGDAGYFRDPVTAHGLTDALRDAELLTDGLTRGEAGLANYVAERDALSLPFLRATDAIAGLDWTLDEVRTLHRDLSAAMQVEQRRLAAPCARAA